MKNKVFAVICAAFLGIVFLAAPVTYILDKNGVVSVPNVGNIIEVEKTYDDSNPLSGILNTVEECKRTIKDIYINYIPGYVSITSAATSVLNKINAPITDSLGSWGDSIIRDYLQKDDDSEETADTDSGDMGESEAETEKEEPEVKYDYKVSLVGEDGYHRIYSVNATPDDGTDPLIFLWRVIKTDRSELREKSQKQISFINSLYEALPNGVNMYVYGATGIEDIDLCYDICPSESTQDIFDNFFASLDEGISADYLHYSTLQERYDLFFHSDHHWNRYGSYQGYLDIVKMMQKNYPDFGDAREIANDFDFNLKFYGSLALELNSYLISDPFGILDFDLDTHRMQINYDVPYGGTESFRDRVKRYVYGDYDTDICYNHFLEFYKITNYIEYPRNDTGRNLLLIGGSFTPCVAEVIASHFDKTIVRYVDSTDPPQIEWAEYLTENNITDVLILEMSSRLCCDSYDDALNNITIGG